MRINLLLYFSALIFSGCSYPTDVNLIYGQYLNKNDKISTKLTIYSNGTYIQEYTQVGEAKKANKNSWKVLESDKNELRLEINKFWFHQSRYEDEDEELSDWHPILEKKWGDIILCFDADIAISQGCYVKSTKAN